MINFTTIIDDESDFDIFNELYEKYRQLCFYVAHTIIEDESVCEDIVQDTCIRVARIIIKEKDFFSKGCHKPKDYIVCICKRIALDYYRQEHRKPIEYVENYELLGAGNSIDSDNEADDDDVTDAIHSLSVTSSEIMELKYKLELNNEEIASILNIKESAVRKRLSRAKQELYAIMKKQRRVK